MAVLKGVAPTSPILGQIPQQYHTDVCIAFLKADKIGIVQPKTSQECAMMIGTAQASGDTQIEIVVDPLKQDDTEVGHI